MQCPCGGSTKTVSRVVKTLEKLREWHPRAKASELPAKISYEVCQGCGRQHVWPYLPNVTVISGDA